MTAVGTAIARTEMLLLDDITTIVRTGKVQSHIESPHQGTPGKDRIPRSAMAKTTETETTTDTTAGIGTGTTAGTEIDMTVGTGTDKTGITVTVNIGRWMSTVHETIVWT